MSIQSITNGSGVQANGNDPNHQPTAEAKMSKSARSRAKKNAKRAALVAAQKANALNEGSNSFKHTTFIRQYQSVDESINHCSTPIGPTSVTEVPHTQAECFTHNDAPVLPAKTYHDPKSAEASPTSVSIESNRVGPDNASDTPEGTQNSSSSLEDFLRVDQVTVLNFLGLDPDERRALAVGPKIAITIIGKPDQTVSQVPKRAIMAISALAQHHFTVNPLSMELNLPINSANKNGVVLITSWLIRNCSTHGTFSITTPAKSHFDRMDIYRAARALQCDRYVAGIKTVTCWDISNTWHNAADLSAILDATTADDDLFLYLAYNYAKSRWFNLLPQYMQHIIENLPRLKQAMADMDTQNVSAIREMEAAQRQVWEEDRQRRWEERRAQEQAELEHRQEAQKRFDSRPGGSKVKMATADDVEALQLRVLAGRGAIY